MAIAASTNTTYRQIKHIARTEPCLFVTHTMKNYSLFLLLLIGLTGCGQVGPLYLPNGPAPIYVPKAKVEPAPESEQKTPPTTPSAPEKTK